MACHSFSDLRVLTITIFVHLVMNDVFINHVNVHSFEDINSCRKFGNILLIPGMGLMEIIITKAIFKQV